MTLPLPDPGHSGSTVVFIDILGGGGAPGLMRALPCNFAEEASSVSLGEVL